METTNQQIGKRLRTMRELFGESQQELANAFDCSRGTVSKYERGLLALSPELINHVCKRYKITHRWLLTGDGPAQSPGEQESDLLALITQLPPDALKPLKQLLKAISCRS
ncbi:TPA: helix-turn-helix domain-containing protein [Vibrio parahaemolyticus]|uniref:helix-turn-helix domain-containing protein n=1 Tax=Vibrio parahaemolyticus TaxID=670 RepID=UPI001D4E79C3|nr:helix-turn-helix transcriptional regulator [Vibrio parahaemolyticus]ELP3316066.1 helix-turn-helix transcriptional regulator [Vibrio fluvialis]EIA5325158.1 helix-turn-helix transcriptional regulator [Vibrio parahaemolyticus]EII3108137.1 helix-turn-helix transcriptional regulator [Vibrio parahaemolyticus]EJC6855369.1 helix-turn-helix transcriptional regulator [Vibrio parahaemolyticus]